MVVIIIAAVKNLYITIKDKNVIVFSNACYMFRNVKRDILMSKEILCVFFLFNVVNLLPIMQGMNNIRQNTDSANVCLTLM
jgi:cytosine/uracil/thiamine/allantoin permease